MALFKKKKVNPEEIDLCEYDGSAEYCLCFYWDDGELEKYETVTITPDHDYDFEDVEFQWYEDFKEGGYSSVEAILTCRRNPDHIKTVEATITEEDDRYIATAYYAGHTLTDERAKD